MAFIFRGFLCGRVCSDCEEPLFPATVRLYRIRDDQDETGLATADSKDTFRILDPKDIDAKESFLIAEVETDDAGNYRFELGDNQDYDGGAFEIDVRLTTVPGLDDPNRDPIQFTITTLRPQWRERGNDLVWGWEYCLPSRFWCRVRELFGHWVICGTALVCDEKENTPVPGLRVFAFDRDWLQDDPLGSAVTDSAGAFRIYYTAADFRPGTFLDIELVGGPDVYFRVEDDATGTVLLDEDPARGRDADRENIGPCFCVTLCVGEVPPPPPPPEPTPRFTHVGGITFVDNPPASPTGIDTAGTGLTVGSGRAFFSTVRLNGLMARQFKYDPSNASETPGALEYKFQTRDLDDPSASWTDVDPATQMASTRIGTIQTFAPSEPGLFTYTPVFAGDSNAPIVDGWIQVPQGEDVFSGFFDPSGDQLRLNTRTLAPTAGTVDLGGLDTGDSVLAELGATGQTPPENRAYAIRMLIRKQGDTSSTFADGQPAGTLTRVAINNQRYDNIDSHPAWVSNVRSNQLGVAMVDIAQLQTNGCAEVGDALDVLVTASHPTLGSVDVSMTGPGGPYAFTSVPTPTDPSDRHGTVSPSGFVVSDLEPCAYIITLSVQLLLTTGDSIPDNLEDQIAFCKRDSDS